MSRKCMMFTAALAALLVFGGAVRAAEAVKATLMNVEGDVQTQKKEGAKWEDAKDGARLSDGWSVKTGRDGKAVLTWGLGNVVRIFPLSSVSVEKLTGDEKTGEAASDVALGHGRVMAQVGKLTTKNSRFNIKTPTAVAGVRGTSFDLNMPEGSDKLNVAVIDGSVSLEAGGVEIMLEAGFESIVAMGEPPAPPVEIPASDFAELKETAAELKEISEKTSGGGGKSEGGKSSGGTSSGSLESATDSVTEAITIQNQTLGTIDSLCTGSGGCILGVVIITPPSQ